MLITKFNRMIRNKVLWGFFAFFVCLSFVISFSTAGRASRRGSGTAGRAPTAGNLFGKDVTLDAFHQAEYFAARFQDRAQIPAERQNELRRLTWQRLAALHLAENMGLRASNAEVESHISQEQAFAENGVFSKNRYKAIMRQNLQIPESVFETYSRQNITIEKLYGSLDAGAWVPATELKSRVHDYTDMFHVEVGLLPRLGAVAPPAPTEDELQKVYEESKAQFRVNRKVSVYYVTFPATNRPAASAIAAADIESYYADHAADFTISVTGAVATAANSNETAAAATNRDVTSQVRPLADVRDEIVSQLQSNAAVNSAESAALGFLDLLLPSEGEPKTFKEATAKVGLTVRETSVFGRFEELHAPADVTLDFNREAFTLDGKTPERAFSSPVRGARNVYVLYYKSEEPAYIPELEEIREKIVALATEEASERAFKKKSDDVRGMLQAALKAGKAFPEALEVQSMNVTTSMTFSVATLYGAGENEHQDIDALIPAIIHCKSGDLTEPVITRAGALFVHVVSRDSASTGDGSVEQRQRVARTLAQGYARSVIGSWGDYILKVGKLRANPGYTIEPEKGPESGSNPTLNSESDEGSLN